jgi:hypothetical protein
MLSTYGEKSTTARGMTMRDFSILSVKDENGTPAQTRRDLVCPECNGTDFVSEKGLNTCRGCGFNIPMGQQAK